MSCRSVGGLYLGEYTACFEEFFVLGFIHFIYICFLLKGFYRLSTTESQWYPIANSAAMGYRVTMSTTVFLSSFMNKSLLYSNGALPEAFNC